MFQATGALLVAKLGNLALGTTVDGSLTTKLSDLAFILIE